MDVFENNPDLGTYELYGTTSSGDKKLVAKIQDGKKEIYDEKELNKLTGNTDAEINKLKNTIIDDNEIARITAPLPEGGWKDDVKIPCQKIKVRHGMTQLKIIGENRYAFMINDKNIDSIYEERNQRFEELSKKRALDAASKLEKAKQQAQIDGKEPFDIDIAFKYYPPYEHDAEELYNNPRKFNSRAKALEERYYTTYYNLMTLKEFGEKMCEMRELGAFD